MSANGNGDGPGWFGLEPAAARELQRRLGQSIGPGDIQVRYGKDGSPRKVEVTQVFNVSDLVEADRRRQA